jgi:hypothetical protein
MFKKVVGKQCNTTGCELSGQMKESSAYLCEKCGMELAPITSTNTGALVGIALGGILLMGGLGWAVRAYVLTPRPDLSNGDKPGKPGQAISLQYAVQSEDDGRPRNVEAGHVFRSGDRFRFVIKSPAASHYYVFYEDRRNDNMEILYPEGALRAAQANDAVAVPAGNGNWITLDQNPGTERFVLIAAAAPIDELDFGGPNCPKSRFDAAMEKVNAKYGVAQVKTVNDLDWTRVEPQGKGLLMTRFSVQHQ